MLGIELTGTMEVFPARFTKLVHKGKAGSKPVVVGDVYVPLFNLLKDEFYIWATSPAGIWTAAFGLPLVEAGFSLGVCQASGISMRKSSTTLSGRTCAWFPVLSMRQRMSRCCYRRFGVALTWKFGGYTEKRREAVDTGQFR